MEPRPPPLAVRALAVRALPALRLVREAALDALALVLPVDCAGCGLADRALCGACRAALAPRPLHREIPGVGPVAAGLGYDGPARRVLLAAKEHGRLDVLPALAPALAAAVVACAALLADPPEGIVLCPVPSSRRSRRRRGIEPVRVLLGRAGLAAPRLLVDRGGGRAQKALGLDARAGNVAGRIRARRPLDGLAVLLVDDVATSGATLAEAARAVRAAGGEVLGAAVALSTPRRDGTAPGPTAGTGPTVSTSPGSAVDAAGSRDYVVPKGVDERPPGSRRRHAGIWEVEHGHHDHRPGGRHP